MPVIPATLLATPELIVINVFPASVNVSNIVSVPVGAPGASVAPGPMLTAPEIVPVPPNVPLLTSTIPEPAVPLMIKAPPLTTVLPEYVFAPEKISVPLPVFIIPTLEPGLSTSVPLKVPLPPATPIVTEIRLEFPP